MLAIKKIFLLILFSASFYSHGFAINKSISTTLGGITFGAIGYFVYRSPLVSDKNASKQFIRQNFHVLRQEIAEGRGEFLDTLASYQQCSHQSANKIIMGHEKYGPQFEHDFSACFL